MPDNEQSRAAITGAAENETQLLPCPFCGGEAEHINSHAEDYWVGCTVCSAAVLEPFQNEAVRQWNTRPLSRCSAEAAALEEKVKELEEETKYARDAMTRICAVDFAYGRQIAMTYLEKFHPALKTKEAPDNA